MNELIAILSLPLKLIAMAVFAVMARALHEQEDLSWTRLTTRFVITMFIFLVSYSVLREIVGFSEGVSLAVCGALGFASNEILAIWLKVTTNPYELLKFRDKLKGKD